MFMMDTNLGVKEEIKTLSKFQSHKRINGTDKLFLYKMET